jgi:16S rRNA (guanine966-N2)-methyltransferase
VPTHKTMRITGGSLVRRRFLIPELVDENVVRPTPDRVREAVFSMIKANLPGARVLDLFAGSGSHGFEALSRGATYVSFVEQNSQIIAVLRKNIESLNLKEHCEVIKSEVRKYLSEAPHYKADIIFVDPPYSLVLDELFFDQLARHLNPEGLVVFRCFKKEKLFLGKRFIIERDRVYGGTRVLLLSLSF